MTCYGWGKWYAKTFTGSMYGAGTNVFALMSYCVANAMPPNGDVEINAKFLAPILGTTEQDVIKAIEYLSSPDANSRTTTDDGKRLIKIGPFLYRLVNFMVHREGTDLVARRAYFRDKQRKYRDAQKQMYPNVKQNVKDSGDTITQAEAEAEAEEDSTERSEAAPSVQPSQQPPVEEGAPQITNEKLAGLDLKAEILRAKKLCVDHPFTVAAAPADAEATRAVGVWVANEPGSVLVQGGAPQIDGIYLVFPVKARKGSSKMWGLDYEKLDEYLETFAGLDVKAEVRKAKQWCVDNPAKQKTATGMPAFLGRWLTKANNNGTGMGKGRGQAQAPFKYEPSQTGPGATW